MCIEVPDGFTISLAAKLAGVSPRAFHKHYINTGIVCLDRKVVLQRVPLDNTQACLQKLRYVGRPYVRRAALEAALGRTIRLAEVEEAERKQAPRRRYQR